MLYLDVTEQELEIIFEEIVTLMGGYDIDVDLTKPEVLIMLRNALLSFEKESAVWQLSNQFMNAYGLPAGVKLTNQLATVNFGLTKQITDWFASMHRVGGKIPWHKDYITLEQGRQIYFLDKESSKPYKSGTRRIHRVMWCGTPEVWGGGHNRGASDAHGDDVLYSNAWNFSQSGSNYAGNQLGFLGYAFDTVLMLQSAETRNNIRFSELFHNLSGDVLEITPMPGHSRGITPGMRVFYYYFDEAQVNSAIDGIDGSISSLTDGDGNVITSTDLALIANPMNMKIDAVPWSTLSPWAQIFVKEMAFAKCKYIQASKWRKIKKTFATGEMQYEIEFDYNSLLQEAKDEETTLISNLRADLKELNLSDLMTKQQTMLDTALKVNSKAGRLWTLK